MENNFDKHIKDSLENLGEDFSPESWDLLYQKIILDPSMINSQSENGFFDENIREKLNQVETNYDPMHWEAMESHLDHLVDQPNVEDLEFDGQIYENLKDLRIPFSQAHWTLMSNRLDEEFSIRRKLYKYKVAEVALMLLALFTLFQYLPLNKKHKVAATSQQEQQVTSTEINQVASIPVLETESEAKIASKVSTTEDHNQVNPTEATNITSEPQRRPTNASIIIDTPPPAETSNVTSLAATTSTAPLVIFDEQKQTVQKQASLEPIVLNSLDIQQTGFGQAIDRWAATKQLLNQDSNPVSSPLLNAADFTLSSLPMELITADRPLPTSCDLCQIKKPLQVRVGMYISSDFNEIMTPEKVYPNFIDAAYQQITAGYGGGISLGFRHKKLEFETGIAYARLSYEPNKTLITTGSFIRSSIQREVFDAAFLNIIKVPMHLNFSFERNSKWHFYAIGGASINVLALNHFNHSTSSVGIGAPLATPREKAPTYDGIFDGGDFKANSYYTANIGMGVERSLTARWSVFMQPVYQHLLYRKGFGPNKDQFNTLSIQIGAKSTFK